MPDLLNYATGVPNKAILSLSPDGRYAVTTRAVESIPKSWQDYEPWAAFWRMKAAPPAAVKAANAVIVPEQCVLIDLETGESTILVNAPLGRSAAWNGLTEALWSEDGREILLTNTFLPLHGIDEYEKSLRTRGPSIVLYDIDKRTWSVVAPFKMSAISDSERWEVANILWLQNKRKVTIQYSKNGPAPETYQEIADKWTLAGASVSDAEVSIKSSAKSKHGLTLSIREDLNTPPALFASADGTSPEREIWDPNPQLKDIDLGEAQPYEWTDGQGRGVKGVLVKPPDYLPGKRYPLVIEARAYSQNRFVLDGTYATATAARVMAGCGLLVLQAGESKVTPNSLKNQLPASLEGYEAAINKLSAEGTIDPSRVGIIGFSRTSGNVLYAITKAPNLFAAATDANGFVYGFMQYLTFVGSSSGNDPTAGQYVEAYGSKPFGQGLLPYLRDNPIFNLDKVTAAVRVETHSPAELLLDWEPYAGLQTLDKPVDLIMLPYATHVVSMPADLDWFRFWLQNYEDPDPSKTEQYKRWESMKEKRKSALAAQVSVPNS
jgi:hypothetical protein